MKAEKITQTAEAFNENVSATMKWFQESTALVFETQSKQIKFATDMYSNLMNAYFGNFNTKNLTSATFGSQKMTEMITINIDHISKMAEENLRILNEFSNQASSTLFVKESMEKLIDYYRKQTEMITTFNQNAMGAFMKETELSTGYMKPFTETLQREFTLTSQLFTEGFKDMVEAFNNMANPSYDSNKKLVGDFSNQVQTVLKNSIGLWSQILNSYSSHTNHTSEPVEVNTKKETTPAKSKIHAAHV